MMRSFLKGKFPGDDWRNGFLTAGSDEVDLNERVVGNDLPNESHNIVKKAPSNMHAPLSAMKKALIEKSDRANQGSAELTSLEKQITTQELHPSFSARTKDDRNGLSLPHMVCKKAHIYKPDRANQGCAESTKESHTNFSLPHEHMFAKKEHDGPESKNGHAENMRRKDKCVAEGTLVSKDNTYVIGGNMLGEQYVAVSISAVSRLGGETLVRHYDKFQTVKKKQSQPIPHHSKTSHQTLVKIRNGVHCRS